MPIDGNTVGCDRFGCTSSLTSNFDRGSVFVVAARANWFAAEVMVAKDGELYSCRLILCPLHHPKGRLKATAELLTVGQP